MALTVLSIKNARPQAKAYKLSDERSLFLLVMGFVAQLLMGLMQPLFQIIMRPGLYWVYRFARSD